MEIEEPTQVDEKKQLPALSSSRRDFNRFNSRNDRKKPVKGNLIPRKVPYVPEDLKVIQAIIAKLADYTELKDGDDISTNIFALFEGLMGENDTLKTYREELIEFLIKCLKQLSMQVPIFTTLIALLSSDDSELGSAFIRSLELSLISSLKENEVAVSKLLLRAVACLSAIGLFNSSETGGLVEILSSLYTVAQQGLNQSELSEDVIVSSYLLAVTIPWSLKPVSTAVGGNELLEKTLYLLNELHSKWTSPYFIGMKQSILLRIPELVDEEMEEEKAISLSIKSNVSDTYSDSLFTALALIKSRNQEDGSFPDLPSCYLQPWISIMKSEELSEQQKEYLSSGSISFSTSFGNEFGSLVTNQLIGKKFRACFSNGGISFELGENYLSEKNSSFLFSRYSIFKSDTNVDCAACCHLSVAEKHLIFSYFDDILMFFDVVINEDGTRLGSIELLASNLLAVLKLFPQVADLHLEYILVEVLFQRLLQLPLNKRTYNLPIYKVLLHLCKTDVKFAPIVALAINTIFLIIPDLDLLVVREFANWFAFHYVNSDMVWPYWDFWVGECGLLDGDKDGEEDDTEGANDDNAENPANHLLQYFVRCVVEKLSKVIALDKLESKIPSEFHPYLIRVYAPNCAYFSNPQWIDTDIHKAGLNIKDTIAKRMSPNDLIDFIESSDTLISEENRGLLIKLFIQALIQVSYETQTLTSLVGLLEIYHDVIGVITETEEHHMILAGAIIEIYGHNPDMVTIVFDEMLRRSQVSVVAVAKVLFSNSNLETLLLKQPVSISLLESVVDRSLDFVLASSNHRKSLNVEFPSTDENANLDPIEEPSEEEMEEEEQDKNGGKKRGRDWDEDGNDMPDDKQVAAELNQKIWAANEALKLSIKNSRMVYGISVQSLTQLLAAIPNETEDSEKVVVKGITKSLLYRVFRSYLGMERYLSGLFNQRFVIADHIVHSATKASLANQIANFAAAWGNELN